MINRNCQTPSRQNFLTTFNQACIKGSGDGEGNQRGKKRKKENLGKIQLLTVLNHKTQLVKHNLTLFKLQLHSFIALWGRKSWQMSRFHSKQEGPTFHQSTLAQVSDTSLYAD